MWIDKPFIFEFSLEDKNEVHVYEFCTKWLGPEPTDAESIDDLTDGIGELTEQAEDKFNCVHDVSYTMDLYVFGFTTYEAAEADIPKIMEWWRDNFEKKLNFKTGPVVNSHTYPADW